MLLSFEFKSKHLISGTVRVHIYIVVVVYGVLDLGRCMPEL